MSFFNRQSEEVVGGSMARMKPEPKPVQEIEMVVEYFDKKTETILLTYNLEELQQQVSTSFGTGSSMNFPTANPPFSINPRWIKKITYRMKESNSM